MTDTDTTPWKSYLPLRDTATSSRSTSVSVSTSRKRACPTSQRAQNKRNTSTSRSTADNDTADNDTSDNKGILCSIYGGFYNKDDTHRRNLVVKKGGIAKTINIQGRDFQLRFLPYHTYVKDEQITLITQTALLAELKHYQIIDHEYTHTAFKAQISRWQKLNSNLNSQQLLVSRIPNQIYVQQQKTAAKQYVSHLNQPHIEPLIYLLPPLSDRNTYKRDTDHTQIKNS